MMKLLPRHIFVESLNEFQNIKHWDRILFKLCITKNCDFILKCVKVLTRAEWVRWDSLWWRLNNLLSIVLDLGLYPPNKDFRLTFRWNSNPKWHIYNHCSHIFLTLQPHKETTSKVGNSRTVIEWCWKKWNACRLDQKPTSCMLISYYEKFTNRKLKCRKQI